MAQQERGPNDWREITTFAIRLLTFVFVLTIFGAVFLPWVQLGVGRDVLSGAELTAIGASPLREFLFAVAPIQTFVLIGCPLAIAIFAVSVAVKYAQRRTALFATIVMLASSIALIFGTQNLIAGNATNAGLGIWLIVTLSSVLLVQQLLIKLRTKLLQKRRFPAVCRALTVFTGSGHYRWREAKNSNAPTRLPPGIELNSREELVC